MGSWLMDERLTEGEMLRVLQGSPVVAEMCNAGTVKRQQYTQNEEIELNTLVRYSAETLEEPCLRDRVRAHPSTEFKPKADLN